MQKYQLKPTVAAEFKVDYENQLNPSQLAAVTAPEGPILVIAGAGSGKTRALTYRVARLVESGVDPSRILLVTFTRKAAREMLQRVGLLTQRELKVLWGGTFHHVGNLVLRHNGHLIGINKDYTILDREDSKDLMDDCVRDLGIDTKARRFPKGSVLDDMAGLAADTAMSVDDIVKEKYSFYAELLPEIKKVMERYALRKKKLNLLDYADLLTKWLLLLNEAKEAQDLYRNKFLHILVDEYQDTNLIQARIIDNLAAGHRNLMVVGDDAQSIYSFRGANFANIIEFPKRYHDAKVFKLETNYRSTPQILELANDSIANNRRQFKKVLVPVKKRGMTPSLVPLENTYQQAQFVAQRILELRDEGMPLYQIACLYRSHYHSMELQFELTRRGIPFQVRSGLRFFEQAHVKDVTSYLKIICNPLDEMAWKRILKLLPKIGNATADKIWKFISQKQDPFLAIKDKKIFELLPKGAGGALKEFMKMVQKLSAPSLKNTPAEAINVVLDEAYRDYLHAEYPNYDERLEDIKQLMDFARQYASVNDFLSELALLGSVESEVVLRGPEETEQVILSSIHQAKGLEWPAVFIIWLNEGRFPAARSMKTEEDIEEERRLFYVGTTRAKDQLYLCYPMTAHEHMGAYFMKPSRFIQELSERHYEKWFVEE
ncbi:MAG: ATP-dependent helicase [Candidatus Omnitrophota bacterium]